MALIPPDIGLQLRAQAEGSLQPVGPARPIPADLPELGPGQRFIARIQEALPENTYKAMVAGKMLTLQLPEGAKAGDLLELVVVDRTPRAILARMAAPTADGGSQTAYPFTRLSPAGQMIGKLLLPEGESPTPAPLNRGQPLVAQPPAGAQDLLPALKSAVARSGLFYESHQAQWVAGKMSLANLLHEPQGSHSAPDLLTAHRIAVAGGPSPGTEAGGQRAGGINALLGGLFVGGEAEAGNRAAAATTTPAEGMPESLRPLVQQQLEAASGQRLMWQGEVWPGQNMDWQIEWQRPDERDARADEDEASRWRTTLSLTTPRLGRVDATLQLEANGVRIALVTPDGASAADLRDEIPALAAALGEAGLPLLAMQVKHETQ